MAAMTVAPPAPQCAGLGPALQTSHPDGRAYKMAYCLAPEALSVLFALTLTGCMIRGGAFSATIPGCQLLDPAHSPAHLQLFNSSQFKPGDQWDSDYYRSHSILALLYLQVIADNYYLHYVNRYLHTYFFY